MRSIQNIIIIFAIIGGLAGCNGGANQQKNPATKKKITIKIPDFNADSAYSYIAKQVSFGPRVPNTENHDACAKYLYDKLNSFADTAMNQKYTAKAFDGTRLKGINIIGSFNPEAKDRVLLCSHWDSRPWADHDSDPAKRNEPVMAANDGASGVGILLEMARQMHLDHPEIGVDIIFFDLEDYGPPRDKQQNDEEDWWALGSQYWARHPHIENYYANYGILLDMAGAKNAKFYMEGYSMMYATGVIKKVWNTARKLNYSMYFPFEQNGYIQDDHVYINEIIGIPSIDIIHLNPDSSNHTFFEYWHTTHDTLDKISKETLKAVGQTLLTVIYEEK